MDYIFFFYLFYLTQISIFFFFSSRRRHTRFDCDWSFRRVLFRSHIMLGTDYPFDMAEPDPVGFLGRVKGVSKKDMALVAGGNAERLLGLPARIESKA